MTNTISADFVAAQDIGPNQLMVREPDVRANLLSVSVTRSIPDPIRLSNITSEDFVATRLA